MEEILQAIRYERAHQDAKWGADRVLSPVMWLTILMEEVGEAAKSVLENDPNNYVEELIQVATVAVAALESYHNEPDDGMWADTSSDGYHPVEGGEEAAKYVQEHAFD